MTVGSTSARILGRTVAVAAMAFVGLVLMSLTAHADQPTQFGWWTTQNQNLPSEPIPTLIPNQPTGPPNTLAADIPPGGFEVANDGAAETSYAAIAYYEYDVKVHSVVLKLAPNASDLPGSAVVACPLSSANSFKQEAGGPISDGPAYSCATAVPGVASADGTSISFAIGGLVQNNHLGIAIVAKQGTNSRMVFDPPGASTVGVAASPPSSFNSTTTDATSNTAVPSTAGPPPAPVNVATTSVPGATSFVQTGNGESPQITSSTSPIPTSEGKVVAESTPGATVGIGSAGAGTALVTLLIVQTMIRNRRNASAANRARRDRVETL
jgi:hypothetical protein